MKKIKTILFIPRDLPLSPGKRVINAVTKLVCSSYDKKDVKLDC